MTPQIQFNAGVVRAGECVSHGLEIVKPNYFLLVGICLLTTVLIACIPCLNYFILGPVLVGVYYTILRQMRDEPIEFSMMFKGFEKFVPAMVIGLIQSIPQMAGDGIRITGNVSDIFEKQMNRGRGGNYNYLAQNMQGLPEFALGGGLIAIIIIIVLLGILFALAWSVTFRFALPLLAEYDLSIGEAISLSARAGWANWSGLILLSILQFLIALVGVLMLCIGIFFVVPIIYAAEMSAYRSVFPEPRQPFSNEPPRPDAYGANYGMPQNFQ